MPLAIIAILIIFVLSKQVDLHAQAFQSVSKLTAFAVTKNSGERTQSKVWTYEGAWWSVFPIASGTYVWRLDGSSWTNVLKISSSSITKADCKTDNNVSHILLWREFDYPSYLVSVEYDPSTKNYKPWSERPSITSINLDPGVETA